MAAIGAGLGRGDLNFAIERLTSYLGVRDDPHAKAVLELFTIGKTLVFVGCGVGGGLPVIQSGQDRDPPTR